jgi:GNAT superfamily N-acetyltransferase
MHKVNSATITENRGFLQITTAETEVHFKGILALQALNTVENLSLSELNTEGFITARHSLQLLQKMASMTPQLVAVVNDEIIGYVLSMHIDLRDELPVLKPMFNLFEQIHYKGACLTSYSFIIGGQICVAKAFRGHGLSERLYLMMKRLLHADYDLCVTEIAVNNTRSMKAHQKTGFETIYTYNDTNLAWNIVIWDWNK